MINRKWGMASIAETRGGSTKARARSQPTLTRKRVDLESTAQNVLANNQPSTGLPPS